MGTLQVAVRRVIALMLFALTFLVLSVVEAASGPVVGLRAVSGATISFHTQNGKLMGSIPPQALRLPYLVLLRNGALTGPEERTLIVVVSDIEVPPAGVTVTLELATQHGEPDGGDQMAAIPVWRESRGISNTSGLTQTGVTVAFRVEFGETVLVGTQGIPTPTDYYRYDLVVVDRGSGRPLYALGEGDAFLLENQWIVRLPEVREDSPGAAPDELIVYYCDMFPFRRDPRDPATGLPREEISDYVGGELVPALVEAFRVQTDVWGFSWHQAWTSYRPGQDAERLSAALTDGETWFHGEAAPNGHAGISINVSCRFNVYYDTLTDGLLSSFHHELFHNLQRNIKQQHGWNPSIRGRDNAWDYFTEGTAVLASSVGQPGVQFTQSSGLRAYLTRAQLFLGQGQVVGELNRLNWSYAEMSPYLAAVYWRFLYEQCGGMHDGVEDSAAGMQIIRRVLEGLYTGEVVSIHLSADVVGRLPGIMDRALAGSSCPFQTYEESLIAFANAIYALRLDGGRCLEPGIPAGCGFYDPDHLYPVPRIEAITYAGAALTYDAAKQVPHAGIPSSFGVDLVEVALSPAVQRQALTVELYGAPGAAAEFHVQVWRLTAPGSGAEPQCVLTGSPAPEVRTSVTQDGRQVYVIAGSDMAQYSRLGLVITRVDANEDTDPIGEYTLVLRPGE